MTTEPILSTSFRPVVKHRSSPLAFSVSSLPQPNPDSRL